MKTRRILTLQACVLVTASLHAADPERATSVVRFQSACRELGLPSSNMLVGFATSMEKILPREAPFEVRPAKEVEISLARNEKESFQA